MARNWLERLLDRARDVIIEVAGRAEALFNRPVDISSPEDNPIEEVETLGDRDVRGPFATPEEAEIYAQDIPVGTRIIRIEVETGYETEEGEDETEDLYYVEVEDSSPE